MHKVTHTSVFFYQKHVDTELSFIFECLSVKSSSCASSLFRGSWWMERWSTRLCPGTLLLSSWGRGQLFPVNSYFLVLSTCVLLDHWLILWHLIDKCSLWWGRECSGCADWLSVWFSYQVWNKAWSACVKGKWKSKSPSEEKLNSGFNPHKYKSEWFCDRIWKNASSVIVLCLLSFHSGKKSRPLFHLTLRMEKKVTLLQSQVLNTHTCTHKGEHTELDQVHYYTAQVC